VWGGPAGGRARWSRRNGLFVGVEWSGAISWKKSNFPPPTFMKVRFSSLNFKTGQITSLNFSNRAFYLPGAVSKAVLLQ
jgi:hypothetical protein